MTTRRGWLWSGAGLTLLLAACVQPEARPAAGFGSHRQKAFAPEREPVLAGTDAGSAEPAAPPEVVFAQPVATAVAEGSPARTHGATHGAAEASMPTADPRARERALRTALAEASDPTEPALQLASFLVSGERHPEALHVVDEALKVSREPALRLARAGLLRDLARPDLAVAELRGLVRELGDAIAPGTLFELAQVEWVVGQRQAALGTLRSLRTRFAGSDWLRQHAQELDDWSHRIAAAPDRNPLANGSMRDLFALLRAAPTATARMRVLESLAQPRNASDDADRRPLRLRAIAIACADESAAVRARAVQLAIVNELTNEAFWAAALTDRSALVRRFAAVGMAARHPDLAAPRLLAALVDEQDPQAFEALHAALCHVHGIDPEPCEAASDAGRAACVQRWQQRSGR